jgi:Ser-tRNA(Ala) deacylase AlaX
MTPKIFPLLEKRSKEIIDSNLNIISQFSDVENEKRYWEIEGFAKVDCGGTHIRKTGEIGDIILKRGKSLGSKVLSSILCKISFDQFLKKWQIVTHFPNRV